MFIPSRNNNQEQQLHMIISYDNNTSKISSAYEDENDAITTGNDNKSVSSTDVYIKNDYILQLQ
jgi:hypothetical protein